MNTSNQLKAIPKHLYSLDILRGIAAFCVVLYHWEVFFYIGTEQTKYNPQLLPFSALLHNFYAEGWRAVQLFFCLSGFIFYWLYAKQIAEKKVNLRDFGLLRFSRLYPLHFATLILVLVLQLAVRAEFGSFFLHPFNDAYHFFLHLFLANHWGLQQGYSFNSPSWSISVEVLLYVAFALGCLKGFTRGWHLLLFILLSLVLIRVGPGGIKDIASAAMVFFCGGLAFKLFSYAYQRDFLKNRVWLLVITCAAAWIIIQSTIGYISAHYPQYGLSIEAGSSMPKFLVGAVYKFFLFPLTIICLALIESYTSDTAKRFAFIGEASYAAYLIHFPLQMLFYIATRYFNIDNSIYYSPFVLILFFSILIPLSVLVYRRFELPAQKGLRNKLVPRKRDATPVQVLAASDGASNAKVIDRIRHR